MTKDSKRVSITSHSKIGNCRSCCYPRVYPIEYANIVPPSCMKSHVHHYPLTVELFGPLPGTWMFGDERASKQGTEMYIHLPTSHSSS